MPASNKAGFTLLEVMVSMTLMAVILAILLAGFRLAENARHRGEEKLQVMTRNLAEIDALQAQVSSAVPRMLTKDDDKQHLKLLSFRGNPKQLRFLTAFSRTGERDFGQWLATFQVQAGSDSKEQLVISEMGTPGDQQLLAALLAAAAPVAQTTLLGEPADRIELSYLEPSTPGKPSTWVPEWNAEKRTQLPRGVQVLWWQGKQERVMTFVIPSLKELQ